MSGTITAAQIETAARRCGVSVQDCRRALLGLPVGSDREKIFSALVQAGCDRAFVAKLYSAPRRGMPGGGGQLGPADEPNRET